MATCRWRGDAAAVAQVTTLTVGGTIETSDIFTVTINGKDVTITAGSTVAATVAATIQAALAASTIPEFQELAWTVNSAVITGTADTAGVPHTITATTTETGGGAADAQTFVAATATAATGPNHWDNADNWSNGAVPVNSDTVYVEETTTSILYGLDQNAVTLTALNVAQSFTGSIGLPRLNSLGYVEYREQKLKISATTINIGYGSGGGPKRVYLNTGTVQTVINVSGSGSSPDGGPAVRWIGTNANNELNIMRGTVGAAYEAGESASIVILRVGYVSNIAGDATVVCGSGCGTITSISQSGGSLQTNSAVTTWTMTDGTGEHMSGALGTMYLDGGTLHYRSTSPLTTLLIGDGGKVSFARDMRSRTVTNCTINSKGGLADPFKTVTFSNGIILSRTTLADVSLDLGTNRTLVPS